MKSTAIAHPNIALAKYWGKRNERLILPHQSSLSVTIQPLSVTTTVEFSTRQGRDVVEVNGKRAKGAEWQRVVDVLNLVRARAQQMSPGAGAAHVISRGNFVAKAGLASSAAAFAALAVASRAAVGLPRDARAESILARRGSGSASRSIMGGFARWNRGHRADGQDSLAEQLFQEKHWPDLRLLVGMVSCAEKAIKSRDGMRLTVDTSPYYRTWVKVAEADVEALIRHIRQRKLEAVGERAERNALCMHASMLGANPPLCYFMPETFAIFHACREARKKGVGVWFTLDAGPNPVLLTNAQEASHVEAIMRQHGAFDVLHCRTGGNARLVSQHLF